MPSPSVRAGLAALVVLLAACGSSAPRSAATTSTTGPSAPTEFAATVQSVNRAAHRVVWKLACGPGAGTTVETDVTDATFEVESNPSDPARGHVDTITFDAWAKLAAGDRWVVDRSDEAAPSVRSSSAPSDHDPCQSP